MGGVQPGGPRYRRCARRCFRYQGPGIDAEGKGVLNVLILRLKYAWFTGGIPLRMNRSALGSVPW